MNLRSIPVPTRVWWGIYVVTLLQAAHLVWECVTGNFLGSFWPTVLSQGVFLLVMVALLVKGRRHARPQPTQPAR